MNLIFFKAFLFVGFLVSNLPSFSEEISNKYEECNQDTAYNVNPIKKLNCLDASDAFLNSFYSDHTPRSYQYPNDRFFKQTSSAKLLGEWLGFYSTNNSPKFGFPDQRMKYDSNSLSVEFSRQISKITRDPIYTEDLFNGFNSSIYEEETSR